MRKKLSQEVIDGILEIIERGDLAVGDQIPTESELADLFEVSRTAVREGIKALIAVGILETQRGVGTFVRDSQLGPFRSFITSDPPTRTQILDLLEFRIIVEPETAALAAQRRTETDLKELKRCVVELEKGVARGVRPPEDLGFHLALARSTGNSALVDTSSMIARFYETDPFLPDELDISEHNAIYEAVQDRDSTAARQLMQAHLKRMVELRSLLDESGTIISNNDFHETV